MKQIINNYIPFSGYIAINLFGTLFIRKSASWRMNYPDWLVTLNHEEIHTALMQDFCKWLPIGGLIFYICYLFEWLWKVLFKYKFSHEAYKNISFEKEAYSNLDNLVYLENRLKFSLWR